MLALLTLSNFRGRSNFCMFAKSEICELNVAIFIKQNIVRLQISVNIIQIMNGLDCQYELSNIESALFLAENILTHEQGHKVTTWKKLHDQVKVLLILE